MKDFARAALLLLAASFVGCQSAPVPSQPLYELSPAELQTRLPAFQASQADLPERAIEIARANIGQPYDLYLLGEAPFETIDPQPIYNLQKSDCVVFVEHTLAMAMTRDFPSFIRMLQRIRYHDGQIGVRTRNHYTEADWNVNNRWLLREITDEVAGPNVKQFKQTVDRKGFFKERYKIDVDVPKQSIVESYVPFEHIDAAKAKLRTGDVVNFVKGTSDTSAWVHHVGFVAVMPDGAVHLIHSTSPKVREESIDVFIARNTENNAKNDAAGKARHRGFKFLRLVDDPIANLRAVDGDTAPKVTIPASSAISFDAYVAEQLKK